jgi:hypothetical protein
MFTYIFRMNFEEQDGFSRDIELRSDQTFFDFYNIIIENLALDNSLECTFYLCDHRFRKRKRIWQPGVAPTRSRYHHETSENEKVFYMDKSILSDFIDDPHQKFIFTYDVERDWNFYIEMIKISPQSANGHFPRINASIGPVPIEISRKPVALPGIVDEDDEEILEGAHIHEDDDQDEYPGMGSAIADDDEAEGSFIYEEEIQAAEDALEEIDDSEFYDDSIEITEDFDDDRT